MLVLLIGSVPAAKATSLTIRNFTSRAALLTARDAWCANRTDGATTFGPIEDWDVTRVRDLSYLFCAKAMSGCNPNCSSFNEAIGSWDMTRVTSLEVREKLHCSLCYVVLSATLFSRADALACGIFPDATPVITSSL